jgi:prevent-host-death family protein
MRTANYTDFRRNLSHYLDSVAVKNEHVKITLDNGKEAVLIPVDDYNVYRSSHALYETAYLTSSPAMMRTIREAQEEIKNGECITLDGHEAIDAFIKQMEAEHEAELNVATKAKVKSNVQGHIIPKSPKRLRFFPAQSASQF